MGTRFQDEMLAAMAHDLRNPMNTILTGAAVLESQGQPDSVRISKMITRAVRRMDDLVADMLDLARLERGLAVEKKLTLLAPLIEDAMRTARGQAVDRIVNATIAVSGEGLVDPVRLPAVLSRLVLLAAGFSPAGGEVRVSALTTPGELTVRVQDSGSGVPAEQATDLFTLHFGRERHGYRDRAASIAIAIAQGVIAAHGGQMRAESRPGEGVTFLITLPI